MVKGFYTVGLFQGEEQIDLAQVNEVYEVLDKVNELVLKINSDLDVKVSTRLADADYIEPDNTTIGQIKTKVDAQKKPLTLPQFIALK